MIEQLLTEATRFFATHSKFIIGAIVNLIIIYVFCKLADAFNRKLEKQLLTKHPDSALINLMPILTRIAKVVIRTEDFPRTGSMKIIRKKTVL